jgi:hypothetical protein
MAMIMQPPGVGKTRLTCCSVECLLWALGLLDFWVFRVSLVFCVSFFLGLFFFFRCIIKLSFGRFYFFFFFFFFIKFFTYKKKIQGLHISHDK